MDNFEELLSNKEIKPVKIPQHIKDLRSGKKKFSVNKKNWHATCDECGCKKMEYYNFRYCCPECGYILEV